jgi:hypothetical protein
MIDTNNQHIQGNAIKIENIYQDKERLIINNNKPPPLSFIKRIWRFTKKNILYPAIIFTAGYYTGKKL